MSEGNFSLHSYDAQESQDIDEFYKELSLQFYAQEKPIKQKVSLLMSGSTEPNSKPSKETLPEVSNTVNVPQRSARTFGSRPTSATKKNRSPIRKGSPYMTKLQPVAHAQKLIKLLAQSPQQKQLQNTKQMYIYKQLETIRKLQLQELKDHYYK